MQIYERLFKIMEERGITQKQLSDYTGISISTISAWKIRGTNPPSDKIGVISDCLGVSVDFLLGRVDNPNQTVSNELPASNSDVDNTDYRKELEILENSLSPFMRKLWEYLSIEQRDEIISKIIEKMKKENNK